MIITILEEKPLNGNEIGLSEGVACHNEGCCIEATTLFQTNVLLTISEGNDVRVRAAVPLCDKCAEAARRS